MMYRCDNCGAEFDEPELYCSRENLDGENWTITTQTVCPYCGTDNITEVKDEPLSD
jgi:DNA-directed RNA polymerase subunit RPC12/RpoP|nr:MAG TPA: DNA-directed RNA polymerase II subunit [Caudoviricetes sp.]